MKKKQFNISLLGEEDVGKSCILNFYIKHEFNFSTLMNIGIDFYIKKNFFDNSEYKFKIFDTAGQERYLSISYTTIQISDGLFMVFEVNVKRSFKKAINRINFIENNYNLEEKVLYLIGNKIDRNPEEIEVTKEEAEIFAKNKNIKYFETSALTGKGINEAFEEMFKEVYEIYKKNNKKNDNIYFEKNKTDNKKEAKDHFEINKKDNKKDIKDHFEMNKKDNKKNINDNFELNNQNNKKKSN